MASLRKALVAGLSIGIGWFLGNLLFRDVTLDAALNDPFGPATSGALMAFAVGALVTFVVR
jgi:hypothetical protein